MLIPALTTFSNGTSTVPTTVHLLTAECGHFSLIGATTYEVRLLQGVTPPSAGESGGVDQITRVKPLYPIWLWALPSIKFNLLQASNSAWACSASPFLSTVM